MWVLFLICLVVAIAEFMLLIDLRPRIEIPLYMFLLGLLMLLIPGINIIEIIILGVILISACNNGWNLAGSNPVSKFFKMLNQTI